MKQDILNRWTGHVQFTAEIEATEDTALHLRIGLAVRWGKANRADLRRANLSGANLSGADLRRADLSGVPRIANIHQAVYSAASKPDALDMATWHTCDTTHCRAGWVITLAGDAGRAMEWCIGTSTAAAIIYMASDPGIERIPNWHASNEDALADMRRLAEAEAARTPIPA
jgi:hypothetical protein